MHKPDNMRSLVQASPVIHHVDFRPSEAARWEQVPALPMLQPASPDSPAEDVLSQLTHIQHKLHAALLGQELVPPHARTAITACVQALTKLQPMLVQERASHWQLEMAHFDALTALAQLRTQLQGSQAGERRARHLAMHDGLTALPNRHHFLNRLRQVMSGPQPLAAPAAVLFIDLDNFKAINDQHGHGAGDELLSITAARLTRALRADDMVGRLGGDEFACLLMNVPNRQLLVQLACKLFDAISATVKIGEVAFQVRPSIGVATASEPGLTATSLLHRADLAMYQAKREQTGYAFYNQDDHIASGEPDATGLR